MVGGVWPMPSTGRGLRIRTEVNFECEMVGTRVQSFPGALGWAAHLGSAPLSFRSLREEMELNGQSLLPSLGWEGELEAEQRQEGPGCLGVMGRLPANSHWDQVGAEAHRGPLTG